MRLLLILLSIFLIDVDVRAVDKPQAAPKAAPKKAAQKKQDQESEGDLRLKIKDIKKLIASDRDVLDKTQFKNNQNTMYNDNIVDRRKLAVEYGREIKVLQRRIAVHEGMLKRWESILIEKTGKLD
jgi:biopolymer transport protein ExbD